METTLCSDCFQDHGLRLDAERIGAEDDAACPACGSRSGRKLDRERLGRLAHSFFVWGTMNRCDYGAAPIVQFNEHQETCITAPPWLEPDLRRIEKAIGVGFFYYGPRLWMIGEVEPLKALEDAAQREPVIERILKEFPALTIGPDRLFYRIRKAPEVPDGPAEYDSPPAPGSGRLDAKGLPVLYGSPDLEVCVHECRVTADDELYIATLAPARELKLLDLTVLLAEEGVTEFDSLDMAVHMLFLAGAHAYPITREIARAAHSAGFDGLVYPSYFSLLRTGAMPFETAYGISHRRFKQLKGREQTKTIPNLALFGRPIQDGKVNVRSINRLILRRVEYSVGFGPVGYRRDPWSSEDFGEEPAAS